ncbi:MAG: hypothetical protein WBA73_08900 [Devosia sp.]|jgi:hypothetical protein
MNINVNGLIAGCVVVLLLVAIYYRTQSEERLGPRHRHHPTVHDLQPAS